jgi:hypothetical protein
MSENNENSWEQAANFPLKISIANESPDGNVEINIEYGEDFKEWFMEREGLKRWSHGRFRKVVGPLVEQYLSQIREETE